MADVRPVQLQDAVTLKYGQDAARLQMLDVCRKALPGWEQLAVADVQVCLKHSYQHVKQPLLS